jgi:hypothetical protein
MTTLTRRQAAALGIRDEYDSDLEAEFAYYLRLYGAPAWRKNYVFHEGRKWEFDFCWPGARLGVYVDGETVHARYHQITRDAEARNQAQLDGWTVFVFTGAMIRRDPPACVATVLEALAGTQTQGR